VIESMSDRVKSTAKKKKSKETYNHIDYECIRCGYNTNKKSSMYNHLYNKKGECPAKINIVLSDDIKDIIMRDRQYHIPKADKISIIKKECKEKIKEVTDEYDKKIQTIIKPYIDKDIEIIYLIKPRANVYNKDNIYKFGQTVIKDKSVNIARILSYGNGSDIILVIECIDSLSLEKTIKNKFEREFISPYGEEYFIGDKNTMKNIIMLSVMEEQKIYDDEQKIYDDAQKILQEKLEEFNTMINNKNANIIVKERRGSF
jgi:hypothetical protein